MADRGGKLECRSTLRPPIHPPNIIFFVFTLVLMDESL